MKNPEASPGTNHNMDMLRDQGVVIWIDFLQDLCFQQHSIW